MATAVPDKMKVSLAITEDIVILSNVDLEASEERV